MPNHGQVIRQLVALGESPGDCWQWLGSVNKRTGYGKKQLNGRTLLAHRWVYEQFLGPIPKGLVINHKCSVRSCVNPHHLEVTTHVRNTRIGRNTIINMEIANEIRRARMDDRFGIVRDLATQYGISRQQVTSICAGRTWKE